MQIKRKLIAIGIVLLFLTGQTFAAEAKTGTNRTTITIDGARYTLNTCSAQERG